MLKSVTEKEDADPRPKKFAVVEETVKKGSENLSRTDIMKWIGIKKKWG